MRRSSTTVFTRCMTRMARSTFRSTSERQTLHAHTEPYLQPALRGSRFATLFGGIDGPQVSYRGFLDILESRPLLESFRVLRLARSHSSLALSNHLYRGNQSEKSETDCRHHRKLSNSICALRRTLTAYQRNQLSSIPAVPCETVFELCPRVCRALKSCLDRVWHRYAKHAFSPVPVSLRFVCRWSTTSY